MSADKNGNRINYPAVVVAGIAYWLLGAAWYTVFSQQWLHGIGKTMEQLLAEGAGIPGWFSYVVSLVSNIVLAYVLSWLLILTGRQTALRGITLGASIWLGVVATTMATLYAFEVRPLQLFAINGGYTLLGMVLTGAIVGGWKKR